MKIVLNILFFIILIAEIFGAIAYFVGGALERTVLIYGLLGLAIIYIIRLILHSEYPNEASSFDTIFRKRQYHNNVLFAIAILLPTLIIIGVVVYFITNS